MNFPLAFIAAGTAYSTLTEYIPSPYFRRSFTLDAAPEKADILVCGLGFYELYINGARVTKGLLSPYISNPDDIIYYDAYDIASLLTSGENVIGLWLGNGFQNNPGGYAWDFDKARWRSAPMTALRLEAAINGEHTIIETDSFFRTMPSPIYNDDYRNGEYYDARREISGWNLPGFDDKGWNSAVSVVPPRGEARLCEAEPIVITEELPPISVTPCGDGFLYDFGVNMAGVCRLRFCGETGQTISLHYGEHLKDDGTLDMRNIAFDENDYIQKDIYIAKGGDEDYTPIFTYHGFRYVFVRGLTSAQAVPEALTYLIFNTRMEERGSFACSDETLNALQALTRRSTLSNFHHFPTDCPQREKNGWTADAALSAEHTLLNLNPETNYREWMRNIRKAQADDGRLPGIIPTAGWGFRWGNGPAWDCVLVYLPYFTFIYRGDRVILEENAHAILRYLEYLTTRRDARGLLAIGLGDWCQTGRASDSYQAPLALTDTIIAMDICEKAAFIFETLKLSLQHDFACSLYAALRCAAREHLVELCTMTASGCCQTSQAMAIFYNVFEAGEKPEAFRRLLEMIRADGDHMNVGVLGARVLFHVLAEFGEVDLAVKMIARTDFPSYGWWIAQGAVSLWEDFYPSRVNSLNHHFWGDISHFFIRRLAGIHYNPYRTGGRADIRPLFPASLDWAEGFHLAPEGELRSRWQRRSGGIRLTVTAPRILDGEICLPSGWRFDDGLSVKPLASGEYTVCCL